MRFASKLTDALSRWVCQLASRRGVNVAAAALANKLARIAWALLAARRQLCCPVGDNYLGRLVSAEAA